jgi:hypothetical protein
LERLEPALVRVQLRVEAKAQSRWVVVQLRLEEGRCYPRWAKQLRLEGEQSRLGQVQLPQLVERSSALRV